MTSIQMIKKNIVCLTFFYSISVFGDPMIARIKLTQNAVKPMISSSPNGNAREQMSRAWKAAPKKNLPESEKYIVKSKGAISFDFGRKPEGQLAGLVVKKAYDQWKKNQLNIIYKQPVSSFQIRENGLGGIKFSPRYKGTNIQNIESITLETDSNKYKIALKTSNGTFMTKENFEGIAIKSAMESTLAKEPITITLDPFFQDKKLSHQEFFITGVPFQSATGYILSRADLQLKSLSFGYDILNEEDTYELYRGMVGSKFYDNEFKDSNYWSRRMIVVKEVKVDISLDRITFGLPQVEIDTGVQTIQNNKFVELPASKIPEHVIENQKIIQKEFFNLSEKFYDWQLLIETAKLSALFTVIQNSNFTLSDSMKSILKDVKVPKVEKVIPIKQSIQAIRANSKLPKYIPYSKGNSYPVLQGGVVFQPNLSIDYNELDFIAAIYDYLEELTGQRIIVKDEITLYKESSGLVIFIVDNLGNRILLDYADHGLSFIGLSNPKFNNYYYMDITSDGSYGSHYKYFR